MIFLNVVPIEIVTETILIVRESAYKTVPSWLVQNKLCNLEFCSFCPPCASLCVETFYLVEIQKAFCSYL